MDMTISIPDDVAAKLEERAASAGTTAPAYTAQLIAESVNKPGIDEILAPVRADFAKTGMTEDQRLDFGHGLLDNIREAKKAKSA